LAVQKAVLKADYSEYLLACWKDHWDSNSEQKKALQKADLMVVLWVVMKVASWADL
jgi:hypothetical protein